MFITRAFCTNLRISRQGHRFSVKYPRWFPVLSPTVAFAINFSSLVGLNLPQVSFSIASTSNKWIFDSHFHIFSILLNETRFFCLSSDRWMVIIISLLMAQAIGGFGALISVVTVDTRNKEKIQNFPKKNSQKLFFKNTWDTNRHVEYQKSQVLKRILIISSRDSSQVPTARNKSFEEIRLYNQIDRESFSGIWILNQFYELVVLLLNTRPDFWPSIFAPFWIPCVNRINQAHCNYDALGIIHNTG